MAAVNLIIRASEPFPGLDRVKGNLSEISNQVYVPNFGGGGRVVGLRMCHPPYDPP